VSSESVFQVARSWVDVGSFLTRLVVSFMTYSVSTEYFGYTHVNFYQNTLCLISEPKKIIYTNLYIQSFVLRKFLTLFLTECENVKALVQRIKSFEFFLVQEMQRLFNIRLQSYTD
jgi:hypothetical protein